MSNGWVIEYHPDVTTQDLPALPRNLRVRILKAVEERLQTAPDRYGRRLRRALAGFWKLRVGDYRVVFEIQGPRVRIWVIAHRREVYGEILRRWGHFGPPTT